MVEHFLNAAPGATLQGAFDPLQIVWALAHSDLAALQNQLRERMVTPENMMSVGAQQALNDIVELEMYLVSQSQRAPWPMLPPRSKKPLQARKPYSNSVESSAAEELVDHGFIEATSSRTFVVSKSVYQSTLRTRDKPHFSLINKDWE
jgi:hypothetical protein